MTEQLLSLKAEGVDFVDLDDIEDWPAIERNIDHRAWLIHQRIGLRTASVIKWLRSR